MFDLAALEGLRVMFSGASSPQVPAVLSAAFLNRNSRGDIASFEWIVRQLKKTSIAPKKTQPTFRATFQSAFQDNLSSIAELEVTQTTHRFGGYGIIFKTPASVNVKAEVTFRNDMFVDQKTKVYWGGMLGVEYAP